MNKFITLLIGVFTFLAVDTYSQQLNIPFDELTTIDTVSARFSAVGDLMCHGTQLKYAKTENDSFNFRPVFAEVKNIFETSDFVFGNLETVIEVPGRVYAGYPVFNTPRVYLHALKFSGFDLLFTTNNHSLDQGIEGVESTLQELHKAKIDYHGTFSSQADRDSIRKYCVNGINFALLSYTYGTNGNEIPDDKDFIIGRIDTSKMKIDLTKAKNMKTDLVIVYLHFGKEYAREPNNFQKMIVKKVREFGVDIILASHTHSLQPVEFFETPHSKLDSGFVVYSLGNFVSNQRWRYSDAGAILNFDIQKSMFTGNMKLQDVSVIPTWVYKGYTDIKKEFIIYPADLAFSENVPSFFNEEDKKLMKESFYDTKEIMTKYSTRVKILSNFSPTE